MKIVNKIARGGTPDVIFPLFSSNMKKQPEFQLQCAIAEYLRLRYPKVPFLSDMRAVLKLTIPQAVRSKKVQAKNFAWPDMFIAFPNKKGRHGLYLELKAESPYKADGWLKAGEHLRDQDKARRTLQLLGYESEFVWSFDMAKQVIDGYLK